MLPGFCEDLNRCDWFYINLGRGAQNKFESVKQPLDTQGGLAALLWGYQEERRSTGKKGPLQEGSDEGHN